MTLKFYVRNVQHKQDRFDGPEQAIKYHVHGQLHGCTVQRLRRLCAIVDCTNLGRPFPGCDVLWYHRQKKWR